jgi:hypothetical protein
MQNIFELRFSARTFFNHDAEIALVEEETMNFGRLAG